MYLTNDNISLKAYKHDYYNNCVHIYYFITSRNSISVIQFTAATISPKATDLVFILIFKSTRHFVGEDWPASPSSPPQFLRSAVRTAFSSAASRPRLLSFTISSNPSSFFPVFGKPSLPPSSALFRPTSLLLTHARWYGTRSQSSSWSRRVFSSPVLS